MGNFRLLVYNFCFQKQATILDSRLLQKPALLYNVTKSCNALIIFALLQVIKHILASADFAVTAGMHS